MTNILHVYTHRAEHQPVYIAADIDALYHLKDAINDALSLGQGSFESWTNDGEGFTIHVLKVPETVAQQLTLPYPEWYSKNGIPVPEDAISPWELVKWTKT